MCVLYICHLLAFGYYSKYSNIKLGKDSDEPEYGDATWFMMLFACGIGVGLFFFGVAEPIFHYAFPNRWDLRERICLSECCGFTIVRKLSCLRFM